MAKKSHQGMQRHGTAWAESLRYRQPQFEGMGGLRRITLNCNTLIGDRGAAALANELTEDLWVKAVDLQRCGLSSEGARRLLEALKTNSTLCVLDIRNNPLVGKLLYCRRGIFESALSPGGRSSGGAQPRLSSHSNYVPWRAAARAGRQSDQRTEMKWQQFYRVVNHYCIFELENARLHSTNQSLSEALASTGFTSAPAAVSVLEDEAVLESIENSFTKFHAFLDLLKDAGLGQLASMAGIDKSDFQPLGKPQLSSTIGPPMDGTTQNAKADVSVMLDVTFTQVAGSAVVPGVHGEGDPDQYSKPVTHESGSERSFGGQKSFEGLPFGKTFETQPRHTKSNSNSQRSNSLQSNGSHRYSFNNSYTNSDASNSKGSHGGLSVRSSVSEVLSDKAESLRSTGSKRREGGRLMTEGRSGSEGSEGGIYPGMEILEQVRSLSSLGGHSDHESF
uniref:Centrosomal protein 78 n=1 Tax=Sphaeramia orbicularis TaxID=375764 RepID=A0A672YUP1_9TELE